MSHYAGLASVSLRCTSEVEVHGVHTICFGGIGKLLSRRDSYQQENKVPVAVRSYRHSVLSVFLF